MSAPIADERMSNRVTTNGAYEGQKDFVGSMGLEDEREAELARLRTVSTVSMSPELFEKLYLSPPNKVRGDLRKTFANPTPIALVGFLLSLTPLTCDLMGWRGAGLLGAATIGVYFFMGGLLMLLGGILEWVLGNSFAAVVFCAFGGFWFSFGATLNPSFYAYGFYTTPDEPTSAGLTTRGFNASLGFWLLFMGVLCLIFLVCALRTNIVFVVIFFSLMLAFFLLTGAVWAQAEDYTGNAKIANRCYVGGGASAFVTCMGGWYLLTAILLEIVDFPIQIPVGDLSSVIRGRSEKLQGVTKA